MLKLYFTEFTLKLQQICPYLREQMMKGKVALSKVELTAGLNNVSDIRRQLSKHYHNYLLCYSVARIRWKVEKRKKASRGTRTEQFTRTHQRIVRMALDDVVSQSLNVLTPIFSSER